MKNYVDGPEIPMGLGMALAKNLDAMNVFASLPQEKKQSIIEGTHQINSKNEMNQYVEKIADGTWNPLL